MSTQIPTNMKNHLATTFWGGDTRGKCIQITANNVEICQSVPAQIQQEGFIQLTKDEAKALRDTLKDFIENKL